MPTCHHMPVTMGRYAWRTLRTYSNTLLFLSCDSLSLLFNVVEAVSWHFICINFRHCKYCKLNK